MLELTALLVIETPGRLDGWLVALIWRQFDVRAHDLIPPFPLCSKMLLNRKLAPRKNSVQNNKTNIKMPGYNRHPNIGFLRATLWFLFQPPSLLYRRHIHNKLYMLA